MKEAQAAVTLRALQASYHSSKGSIQWWKTPDGSWVARTVDQYGDVKLQKLPAGSCNCG